MEKQFAEKISKETGIDYLKIYILLYEYIRFIWGRAEAGAKETFAGMFTVRANRAEHYYKRDLENIRKGEFTEIYKMIIDKAFYRACYVRRTGYDEKFKVWQYRALLPIDYNPETYWRNNNIHKDSKEMAETYKKFNTALYQLTVISTDFEKQMYEYCKEIFKLYLELPKVKSCIEYCNLPKPKFKLKFMIKNDKTIRNRKL